MDLLAGWTDYVAGCFQNPSMHDVTPKATYRDELNVVYDLYQRTGSENGLSPGDIERLLAEVCQVVRTGNYMSKEALASIEEGLASARRGEIGPMGDFTQYVGDGSEE